MSFEIIHGDITRIECDAVVNAAKPSLKGGGGVDGAIHKAAGPELHAECLTLNGCKRGEAKLTKGYALPCKFVIHTVGPRWWDGKHGEIEILQSCYYESLKLASENGMRSVAFPLIGTGAYRCPPDVVQEIAAKTIQSFLETHTMDIYLVIFDGGAG